MKIVAFGASNSATSINKKLATFVATEIQKIHQGSQIDVLDLNDYECPIFSPERMSNEGIPKEIEEFLKKVNMADLLVISFAEYNGSYTAAFKNIFDWSSVKKNAFFENKKMILLSTSNGARGALTVLESARLRIPMHGGNIFGSLHVPFYSKQFDTENNILNKDLYKSIKQLVKSI